MDRQECVDYGRERMLPLEQLDNLLAEWRADRSREHQAILLQHAADLVFDIPSNTDEPRASDQDCADFLALLALDGNLSEPANSDEIGKAARLILVALIHAG